MGDTVVLGAWATFGDTARGRGCGNAVADQRDECNRRRRPDPSWPAGVVDRAALRPIAERVDTVVDDLDDVDRRVVGRCLGLHDDGQVASTVPSGPMICAVYGVGSLKAYAENVRSKLRIRVGKRHQHGIEAVAQDLQLCGRRDRPWQIGEDIGAAGLERSW